jgi:hypothetical protein
MFHCLRKLLSRITGQGPAFRPNKSGRRLAAAAKRPGTFRASLEELESRLVPSTVPLHVAGNQLQDPAGNAVVLRGVNIASLESYPTGDVNDQGDPTILRSVDVALNDWHANLLRVTVYPDFWSGDDQGVGLGKVDPTPYRNLVDQIVSKADAQGAYVMLAVWGSDMGNVGAAPAMHNLPDAGTAAFWRDAALRYANQAAVMFDPMNEPHLVSWDEWRNGGRIFENGAQYDSPGMQGLLDAIRGTGANNIVAPEGLSWGADLSGVTQGFALNDPAGNLMYQVHLYPAADAGPDGVPSVATRDARVQAVAAQFPLYVGEWGTYADDSQNPDKQNTGAGWPDAATYSQNFLSWLDQHPYSWTAWDLNPNSGPDLISDWNYTPTDYFGAYVKDYFTTHANNPAPNPAPIPAPGLSAAATFADTFDWGTGFTGQITLTNTGNTAINGWTLEFDFTGNITDIWSAQIVSHVGDHYVIQNAPWDAAIAPGQSISFGFNADWGDLGTLPGNYLLNGVQILGL